MNLNIASKLVALYNPLPLVQNFLGKRIPRGSTKYLIGYYVMLISFRSSLVTQASRSCSDHCPLIGSFNQGSIPKGFFKFQNMWCSHPTFLETVSASWHLPCQGEGMRVFADKLKRLKKELIVWNKNVFGNIQDKLKLAEVALTNAEMALDSNYSEAHVQAYKTRKPLLII